MAVTESDFRQAMADVNNQMQMTERALTARIALAESEVLRLRSRGEDGLAPLDRARVALGEDAIF